MPLSNLSVLVYKAGDKSENSAMGYTQKFGAADYYDRHVEFNKT